MTESTSVKKCDYCKSEIDSEATRCSKCQADLRGYMKRHPIGAFLSIFILFIFLMIILSGASDLQQAAEQAVVANSGSDNTTDTSEMQVGDSGFIRLPDNSDVSQKICLGESKDDANQITKALIAKDYLGLIQIPGAFCVSNGTPILLIEKDFPLRKVRITGTIDEIDSDKFGMAGWLPLEWVVNK